MNKTKRLEKERRRKYFEENPVNLDDHLSFPKIEREFPDINIVDILRGIDPNEL